MLSNIGILGESSMSLVEVQALDSLPGGGHRRRHRVDQQYSWRLGEGSVERMRADDPPAELKLFCWSRSGA
jgi:hypothetical protein